MVGPLPFPGGIIGGTQVSFAESYEHLRRSQRLEVTAITTSRTLHSSTRLRSGQNLFRLLSVLAAVCRKTPRSDAILFCASPAGLVSAGPIICAWARLSGTPVALRCFGGSLDLVLERSGPLQRRLVDGMFTNAGALLLQTHHLCTQFSAYPAVRWFPTTRSLSLPARKAADSCRRFIFLSQLRPEKGVLEALAASDQLAGGATIDFYGPLTGGLSEGTFANHANARYRGSVSPTDVANVIGSYDALVFPTYYEGEGLPGVVLEAFQLGLPVLASRWRSLDEVVHDGGNGLLIAPADVAGLVDAMNRITRDSGLYRRLSAGALETGARFQTGQWLGILEDWLVDLSLAKRRDIEVA